MTDLSAGDRYLVPALQRGMQLLGQFSRDERELTGAELSRRLDLPRASVFRLLQTLEQMGFVERVGDSASYKLGIAVLRLGFEYLASMELTEHGRPIIDALCGATGLSSHLVVRDGRVITHPDKRASSDNSIKGWKKLAKIDDELAREKADAIIKNTYRTLMTRGMRGCFVYFTDRETADYFRSRLTGVRVESAPAKTTALPVAASHAQHLPDAANEPTLTPLTREQARHTERTVPVVSLKIAAGAFSGTQSLADEAEHWVQLPEGFASAPGLFVARVIGESMNKRIPNGAWCLFRANPVGSRQGKIVLVQHRDVTDPETGGSYTVKRYQSEKQGDGDGWQHERITLMPISSNSQYLPLVLVPKDEGAVRVVAEWVAVVG